VALAVVILVWLFVSVGCSLGLAYVLGAARRETQPLVFEEELHSLAA
jgi:hypothetical protein